MRARGELHTGNRKPGSAARTHLLNQVSHRSTINSESDSEFEEDEIDNQSAPKQHHQQAARGEKW